MMQGWSNEQKLGLIGVVVAILTLIATFLVPEGRRIVGLDEGGQLATAVAEETGLVRLTDDIGNEIQPSFSADGELIVYTADGDGNAEIYTMNVDRLGKQRRTFTDVSEDVPSFSPDGRQILFGANYDGNQEIYLLALDENQQIANISNSPDSDEGRARFVADGKRVVFDSDRSGNWEIYLADYQNDALLAQTALADRPDHVDRYPVISDLGDVVYFRSGAAPATALGLYSIEIDGSNSRLLTKGPNDLFPSVTEDGEWMVFSSTRSGNLDLYALHIRTGEVTQLTDHLADDSFPSVSKNGCSIAFASNRDDSGYDIYKMPFKCSD